MFNPAYFETTEYFEYLNTKLDLYTVKDCNHFLMDGRNSITEQMRYMQTVSAIIFFFSIHVPLSRLNVGFCLLTAFFPLCLNLRTKYWFYEKSNRFVCKIWKDDPEARNYIKRPKNMKIYDQDPGVALGELNEEAQNELEAKSEIHLTIDTKES